MLDVFITFLLIHSVFCKIPTMKHKEINEAHHCVINILKKYYSNEKMLTFVNLNIGGNELLREINNKLHISVISRTWTNKLKLHNPGYVILVRGSQDFMKYFKKLSQEAAWNPLAKFVVAIESLDGKLYDIFKQFLDLHIINIVVVNGTIDPDLYTYNPYDNNGCGKRFSRIISYGKCNNSVLSNQFPKRFTTELTNCTLNIGSNHAPPYSIDHTTQTTVLPGTDEYVFKIIGEIKQFETNYTLVDFNDFTVINDDMTAVGSLKLLQMNKVDVIFGGMVLSKSRADAFDYIYSHGAFEDDIRIMVKRAIRKAAWKNIYLEFSPTVWIMIVVSYMAYSLFFIIILRVKDKSSIMLTMWDSFFLHGHQIPRRSVVKYAFIMWVWYAYLINFYYQSAMYSLRTKPVRRYQISTEEDLNTYKIKPCLSSTIRTFLSAEGMYSYEDVIQNVMGCQTYFQSLTTVSNTFDLFTIVMRSIYYYNRHSFFNQWGISKLYSFSPTSKILYATYFYKGFPMRDEFEMLTLRIGESGLLQKVRNDLFHDQEIKYNFAKPPEAFKEPFMVIVPWYLLGFGMVLATIIFVLEILVYRKKNI